MTATASPTLPMALEKRSSGEVLPAKNCVENLLIKLLTDCDVLRAQERSQAARRAQHFRSSAKIVFSSTMMIGTRE